MRKRTLILSGVLALVPSVALAQTAVLPGDDSLKGANEEDVEGWNPTLGGTATINLVSNSSVVGQVDGTSLLVGLGLAGGADYVKGKSVVRTTLTLNESVARTPVIDEFVKTNDVIQLEGLYNYYLNKKFGLFARLNLQTALFATDDVRGVDTSWVRKEALRLAETQEALPLLVQAPMLAKSAAVNW